MNDHFHPLFRIGMFCFVLIATIGCTKKNLKPAPDFSAYQKRLSDSSKGLRGISTELNEEFIGLNTAMTDVSLLSTIEYSDTFPKNLFKHALMACLNKTKRDENEVADQEEIELKSAIEFGVTCDVLPVNQLIQTLKDPENLNLARRGMQALEKVRQHRGKIQKMVQEIPDRILEIRNEINIQSGELRRKKSFLQTKRNDYSTQEWETTQDAVKAYEAQLDGLQSLTKTLLLNKKLWHQKLGSEIEVLYKNIAKLGEE